MQTSRHRRAVARGSAYQNSRLFQAARYAMRYARGDALGIPTRYRDHPGTAQSGLLGAR